MSNIPDIVENGLKKHYTTFEEMYLQIFLLFQETEKGYDGIQIGKKTYHHVLWKTKSIYIYKTFTQSIEEGSESLIINTETISREEYQSIYNFLHFLGKEESIAVLDQLRVKYIPTIKQYLHLECE